MRAYSFMSYLVMCVCVCVYLCACVCSQASGGSDNVVHVWDAVLHLHLHTFKGHKDTVTVSHTCAHTYVFLQHYL